MQLTSLDIIFFLAFVAFVVGFAILMSRKERDSTDYFLAGRGATWPLIGFSLIAANISTEQFVGMSGAGAGNAGLAIASYEWIAAITLVIVALFFLPRFLRAGIFTIPEYLEYRYSPAARVVMSLLLLTMFVFITTVAVVFSGGVTLDIFFGNHTYPLIGEVTLVKGIWAIGLVAVIYTAFGGLRAVLWADLVQGSALILGGAAVTLFTLKAAGGWNAAMAHAEVSKRMHMVLPSDHPELPWTIFLLGIWIPNLYYWGLNQYITQRTLAAKTLRAGQLGVMFAACLKLIIPFVIVIPGILAPLVLGDKLQPGMETANDPVYPMLIRELIGPGWRGFVLAALAGAVISSLASMLNSASTIFTMDVYKRLIMPSASQISLVWLGRITTILFMIIACVLAPSLADPRFGGVFKFIQEFQGLFSPGILAAFVVGFAVPRAPAAAAIVGMVISPLVYGVMKWPVGWYLTSKYVFETAETRAADVFAKLGTAPGGFDRFMGYLYDMAFLNRMGITFVIILIVMAIITKLAPLREPRTMPVSQNFDMQSSRSVSIVGGAVVLVTVGLYVFFW
ncbi:MAG TPA: sodium/solute symporter [Phycisphaerae bacterium]|nr:sodium/solute symporter [Phycisphaerae bacterium]HOM49712.1 sodium/solute symporter [Phycisphaerae bacterium]HPU24842.1 sodium/solute symporter [Phycisphaerae bacterium]HPZ99898.1 sodium/solute symporter [Phycisphaerae bacterium]